MEEHVRAILDARACNICGAALTQLSEDRETPDCAECGSNRRLRSLIAALCQAMFATPIGLSELPELKEIRGIGMSDSLPLAERLARKFDYTNTFYHCAPRLDLTNPDPREFGRYDFILSSEVMEHVPPPIERAFENLLAMLKPNGLLLMTTPFLLDGKTHEHFPDLHEFSLAKLGDRIVLVNRTRAGATQVFEDLAFHGGPGSTLEMRIFTLESLRRVLLSAGFAAVEYCEQSWPEFGIEQSEPFSLPIVARKGDFRPPLSTFTGAYRYSTRLAAARLREFNKQTADFERYVEYHNTSHKADQKERVYLAERRDIMAERLKKIETARWTRIGRRLGMLPKSDQD